MWEDLLADYNPEDPKNQESIKEIWKDVLDMATEEQNQKSEELGEQWRESSEVEHQQYQSFRSQYTFESKNIYENLSKPLESLRQVLDSGNVLELIKVLEAHLAKNPQDAEGWRALGHVHQEQDQDQKGLTCFLKAVQIDPADRHSLLQLGVSCTNIFDEVHAMNYIGKWEMVWGGIFLGGYLR